MADRSPADRLAPLRHAVYGLMDRLSLDETTTMILVAAVVGVVGGYGAILFRLMVQFFQGFTIGRGTDVVALLQGVPWWKILLLPAAGGLVVGPMIYYLAREAKGHGVPEVIEAVVFHGGVIRPIVAAVKITASAITIACGGSVGREGPIIQIGAGMASTFGQWLRFSPQRLRTLVGCGAAAGIAATFNAPIAGALFAVEIILRDFAIMTFSPIIVSSVMATVISRHYLGDHPSFHVPHFLIHSWIELPAYALMGIVVGLGSIAYIRTLYWTEGRFDRLRLPEWLKPALGGLLLGGILILVPQTYGIGYASMVHVLNGAMGRWHWLLLLFAAKLVAVDLTLGSGQSGGIFAPALFLGGVLGAAYGALLHPLLPVHIGGFAMVGMAAMVAASARAPLTAILILFEMTGEYAIILPLMLACIVATLVSQRLLADSIFTLKFTLRGQRLNFGRESTILKNYHVQDVMETHPRTLPHDARLDRIVRLFLDTPEHHVYVVDDGQRLVGEITIHDVKGLLHEDQLRDVVIAADIARPVVRKCYRQDDLEEVYLLLAGGEAPDLPVLDRPRSPRLVGIVTRKAIFDVYAQEVLHKDVAGFKIVHQDTGMHDVLELPAPYKVTLFSPPPSFVGRTLRELDLRRRYQVTVLAFKRKGWSGDSYNEIPDPDRRIETVDRLIVVGRQQDLDRLWQDGEQERELRDQPIPGTEDLP